MHVWHCGAPHGLWCRIASKSGWVATAVACIYIKYPRFCCRDLSKELTGKQWNKYTFRRRCYPGTSVIGQATARSSDRCNLQIDPRLVSSLHVGSP